FLYSYLEHRNLHLFPTRRSSDLNRDSAPGGVETSLVSTRHARVRTPRRCQNRTFYSKRNKYRAETQTPHPDHPRRLRGLGLGTRSEEHTSELQSHLNLVCRLMIE